MFQNINNILRLIEEGKIDSNQAVDLIRGTASEIPLIIL
jgi:hypothetical protein